MYGLTISFCLLVATAGIFNISAQTSAQSNPQGQYEAAIGYYEKLLTAAPEGTLSQVEIIKARTDLGTAYFMLHRYADSLRALEPLISGGEIATAEAKGVPAQAWAVRGLDFLELNQLPEAIDSLRQAVTIDPLNGTARLALGDALARSDHLNEAEQEYDTQTKHTPSLPDAWYKLGLVHAKLASELPLEFSQKFRDSVIGRQLAAEEQLAGGNNLEAARSLFRLAQEATGQPQVHSDLGTALLELGYSKRAKEEFRQELAIDPHSPPARLGIAETEALEGEWAKATSDLERVFRASPHELARLLNFPPAGPLRQAAKQGKLQVPDRFLGSPAGDIWNGWLSDSGSAADIVSADTTDTEPCKERSSTVSMKPGAWLSEACYETLLRDLGGKQAINIEERIKLTEAEFRLGKHDAAMRDAKQILASSPQNGWGIYWLSKAHAALAEDCFLQVAALNPESARVHQMLAQHYAGWSDYSRAKSEYLAAIRLAPELPDLHLGLGSVYWKAGEFTDAEKELKKTLELVPGSAAARYELGDVYVRQGQWELAIAQLRNVPDDSGFGMSARVDLAKAEDQIGQTRQALNDLLPVKADDKDGQVHFMLAGLYRKLGDPGNAQLALATFKRLRAASLSADQNEFDALQKEQDKAQTAAANSTGSH